MTVNRFLSQPIAVACLIAFSPLAASTSYGQATQPSKEDLVHIQTLFAQATNAALTRDGFSSLLKLIGDSATQPQDKTPVNLPQTKPTTSQARALAAGGTPPTLVEQIDQFNRDWKQKYSRDFRIGDPTLVLADLTVNDILSPEPQLASGHLPVPSTTQASAIPQSHPSPPEPNQMTVNAPTVMGSRPAIVQLVRATDGFRFAAAGSVDSARLASALQASLKSLSDLKDHWPIDSALAQRLVVQYVITAISQTAAPERSAKQAGASN